MINLESINFKTEQSAYPGCDKHVATFAISASIEADKLNTLRYEKEIRRLLRQHIFHHVYGDVIDAVHKLHCKTLENGSYATDLYKHLEVLDQWNALIDLLKPTACSPHPSTQLDPS